MHPTERDRVIRAALAITAPFSVSGLCDRLGIPTSSASRVLEVQRLLAELVARGDLRSTAKRVGRGQRIFYEWVND